MNFVSDSPKLPNGYKSKTPRAMHALLAGRGVNRILHVRWGNGTTFPCGYEGFPVDVHMHILTQYNVCSTCKKEVLNAA